MYWISSMIRIKNLDTDCTSPICHSFYQLRRSEEYNLSLQRDVLNYDSLLLEVRIFLRVYVYIFWWYKKLFQQSRIIYISDSDYRVADYLRYYHSTIKIASIARKHQWQLLWPPSPLYILIYIYIYIHIYIYIYTR